MALLDKRLFVVLVLAVVLVVLVNPLAVVPVLEIAALRAEDDAVIQPV